MILQNVFRIFQNVFRKTLHHLTQPINQSVACTSVELRANSHYFSSLTSELRAILIAQILAVCIDFQLTGQLKQHID